MRKPPVLLTALLVLATLGWGGYWYLGKTGIERGWAAWFEARRAEGWVAETTLAVQGFPNRLDTSFTDLALADPRSGVALAAPLLQVLSLSYRPTDLIVVAPMGLDWSTPEGTTEITGEALRASLSLTPTLDLGLVTGTAEAVNATFAGAEDTTRLARGLVSVRRTPEAGTADSYDLAADLTELAPGDALMTRIGAGIALPESLSTVSLRATVSFDAPWDRGAVETRRPQPRTVALDSFAAQWGELAISATGTLEADSAGLATGSLALELTRWREVLAVADAAGLIAPGWLGPITAGLGLIAGSSGDADTLEVPVSFRAGRTFIGPLPVGPAPELRLP